MSATRLCQTKCTPKKKKKKGREEGFHRAYCLLYYRKTKRAVWFLERDLIVSAESKEQIKTQKRAKPHLAKKPWNGVGWWGVWVGGWGGDGIRGQLIFSVKSQSNTANPHCQAGASMQTWIRPHPEHPCPQGTSTQLLLDGKSFVKSFATASQRG